MWRLGRGGVGWGGVGWVGDRVLGCFACTASQEASAAAERSVLEATDKLARLSEELQQAQLDAAAHEVRVP